MNNIYDGNTSESRIKLIRDDSLGLYSLDSSANALYSGQGMNEWQQTDLKDELNGDYLNTNLQSNTYWYNGQNNQRSAIFDYTKKLNAASQDLIKNAKWYLGGLPNDFPLLQNGGGNAFSAYNMERATTVWGSSSGQVCEDGYCPRSFEWTGLVALMYISDLGFAVGGNNRSLCLNTNVHDYVNYDCIYDDWMEKDDYQWTLSPASYYAYGQYFVNYYVMNGYTYLAYDVRPVVFLKPGVSFASGNGSEENPYVLE